MKRVFSVVGVLFITISNLVAQNIEAYPSNWFVNMNYNKVQVLLRNTTADYKTATVQMNYPGVTLKKVHPFENGHYIAVDLEISANAKPGKVPFAIVANGLTSNFNWPLLPRRKNRGTGFAQGLTSADLVYFLMPDRFSNGDPSNDKIPGLRDQSLNRGEIFLRHGGDLQGVANHLDYLQKLGTTTLWMTPVVENDMPDRTEHGYAVTDNYKTESRFGGDKAYLALSDSLHQRGMKLIQDIVYNHYSVKEYALK